MFKNQNIVLIRHYWQHTVVPIRHYWHHIVEPVVPISLPLSFKLHCQNSVITAFLLILKMLEWGLQKITIKRWNFLWLDCNIFEQNLKLSEETNKKECNNLVNIWSNNNRTFFRFWERRSGPGACFRILENRWKQLQSSCRRSGLTFDWANWIQPLVEKTFGTVSNCVFQMAEFQSCPCPF